MENFKVIIVEDVALELKGTEGIFRNDIPEAEIIGTADSEVAYWRLMKQQKPDMVLLDLGLGGSTTVGVEICRQTKEMYPAIKILIFTGEILNEKLWVEALDDFLEYGLVEHHFLACHHADHIAACEQFSALQAYTVTTGIEHVNP